MSPILNLIDFIFSHYFDEFLNYNYIKKLELPLWFFLLVGVLLFLAALWIILVAHGVKHIIYRCVVCRSRQSTEKNRSRLPGRSFSRSRSVYSHLVDTDESNEDNLFVHILPRRPTH